jgi:predicted regulator of Ras-like GTPase activity (Roadblock/LC7/MglB family)
MGGDPASSFDDILKKINRQGDFLFSVLSTEEGFPIAFQPGNQKFNQTSAMTALLHQVCQQTRSVLELDDLDEITIRTQDHTRLIIRSIQIGGERVLLSVLIPADRCYRQLTNQALRSVRELVK